ncbi:hypothetical protein, partial [Flavobacterium filum]|uniref:hypothetical protein n=1 Tax=Flavobacterium filum TaxID=370974 RepID=UPI0023F38EE1
MGWWVGFGWLGSFGFLKRWFVCREKPNVPNALAKNFLSCELGIFYFFLCRTVVWSGFEVSVRVVVLPLPLTFLSYTQAGILTTELPT